MLLHEVLNVRILAFLSLMDFLLAPQLCIIPQSLHITTIGTCWHDTYSKPGHVLQSSLAVFSTQCCKQGNGSGEGSQVALGTLLFCVAHTQKGLAVTLVSSF